MSRRLFLNLIFKGQVGRLLPLHRMVDQWFFEGRWISGCSKEKGKKKLTDIGLWFFLWIPDSLQKLTGRSVLKDWWSFQLVLDWIDIVYQSTSGTKVVRQGLPHKSVSALF